MILRINRDKLLINGHLPLERIIFMQIPEENGVYMFSDFRGIYYIGKSINLRKRFQQHLNSRSNTKLIDAIKMPIGPAYYSWVVAVDDYMDRLEQSLIRYFSPDCNQIVFKTYKE